MRLTGCREVVSDSFEVRHGLSSFRFTPPEVSPTFNFELAIALWLSFDHDFIGIRVIDSNHVVIARRCADAVSFTTQIVALGEGDRTSSYFDRQKAQSQHFAP